VRQIDDDRLMSKPRVLVVDDYPGARYRRMRILLDDGGFEVTEEMLGRNAVRRLAEEPIDALLVDLHLPDINGLEVCRAVRQNPRTATLPIVLISAVSEVEEASKLAETHGADCFLPDTVSAETLLETMRGLLKRTRPE
jgi:CheY-like chemotaxis protein